MFTFLYHYEVPSNNNSTEQAIGNAKVELKASIIRSITGACKKNQQHDAHGSSVALIAGLEQVNRAFGAVRGMLSATMYLLTCTKPPRNTVGANDNILE